MSPAPTPLDRREALRRVAVALGATLSAPTLAAALAACAGDAPRDAGRGDSTATLTADQRARISAIAEHILPATDTPGAIAAGVPAFVATVIDGHLAAPERARFVAGLDALDRRARREGGATFVRCTPAVQLALLTRLDMRTFAHAPAPAPGRARPDPDRRTLPGAGATPVPPELDGDARGTRAPAVGAPTPFGDDEVAFFRAMKELTLLGYYTSQPGATRELRYAAVPGRYDGCVPVDAGTRTWAV